MAYRALRGVCISPGRHLLAGEVAELDPATSQFLVGIGAVEAVVVKAPVAPVDPIVEPITPVKAGKKEK